MGDLRRVLSPEVRLLLATVREGLDGREAAADISPAAEPLDWGLFFRLVARERVATALHPLPERLGAAMPDAWDERFRSLGAISGFRLRRLFRLLDDVVARLEGEGISVTLLKGAALAVGSYDHPLQRPMSDLDLLVDPGRAGEAWDLLRGTGWAWHRERYPRDLYAPRQHLPPLEDPRGMGQFVEVHDDLFIDGHPFRLGPEDLRRESDPLEVGGTEVRVPGPMIHLVYTCIHFAWAHCLSKGGWRAFRDVAVLARRPEFDWGEFLERARCSGAEIPCYWTLRLARDLGGVAVPREVLAALEPALLPGPVLRGLERHFALALFPAGSECPSVALRKVLWRTALGSAARGPSGVLPWTHDAGFLESGRSGEERSNSRGATGGLVARHLRSGDRWGRFLRGVLGREERTGIGPAADQDQGAEDGGAGSPLVSR